MSLYLEYRKVCGADHKKSGFFLRNMKNDSVGTHTRLRRTG